MRIGIATSSGDNSTFSPAATVCVNTAALVRGSTTTTKPSAGIENPFFNNPPPISFASAGRPVGLSRTSACCIDRQPATASKTIKPKCVSICFIAYPRLIAVSSARESRKPFDIQKKTQPSPLALPGRAGFLLHVVAIAGRVTPLFRAGLLWALNLSALAAIFSVPLRLCGYLAVHSHINPRAAGRGRAGPGICRFCLRKRFRKCDRFAGTASARCLRWRKSSRAAASCC